MITITCLMGEVVFVSLGATAGVAPLKVVPTTNWKSATEAMPMRRPCRALDAALLKDIRSLFSVALCGQRCLVLATRVATQCCFREFRITTGKAPPAPRGSSPSFLRLRVPADGSDTQRCRRCLDRENPFLI